MTFNDDFSYLNQKSYPKSKVLVVSNDLVLTILNIFVHSVTNTLLVTRTSINSWQNYINQKG